MLICLSPLFVKGDILLQEDFSTLNTPSGWYTYQIQGTAQWTFRDTPTMGSSSTGGYAVFDDQALGAGTTPNEAFLRTSTVDCTDRPNVYLTYSHFWLGVEFTHGIIEITTDNGTTYNTIIDYHKVTKGSLLAPQDTTLNISSWAANEPAIVIRFRYTDGSQAGQFWYLDDVIVHTGIDVEVTKVTVPDYLDCYENYGPAEPVTLRIFNHGIDSISNVPISCTVSGGTTANFSEIYTGTIPPQAYADHTFAGTIDMTAAAIYYFEAIAGLSTDEYILNDTLNTDRWSIIDRLTLPYFEDFETGYGGWEIQAHTNGTTYLRDSVPYLNGPEGNGISLYAVSFDYFNSYASKFIESPVFDLSENTEPHIYFDIKHDLSLSSYQFHYVEFEYSLDNGVSWQKLGNGDSPNWYTPAYNSQWNGTMPEWYRVSHSLCELSGETCVKLRFHHRLGGSFYNNEFAIDNILVTEGTGDDLHVMQFYPAETGTCSGFTSSEPLGLTIRNNTCRPLTQVPVQVDITGPNSLSFLDSIPGPIPPFSYYYYPFTPTIDMSVQGTYSFQATLINNFDGDSTNYYQDTALVNNVLVETRLNGSITNYPYLADFNTNNDSWSSKTDDNLFLFVRDTLRNIGGSEGYNHSWVLEKINGSYNDQCEVISPVFDLSGLTDPNLYMDIKHDIFGGGYYGNTKVMYSTNGGTSWTLLGTDEFPNWFNSRVYTAASTSVFAFSDTTWHQVQFPLCDLKNSCVQFKIEGYNRDHRLNEFAFDNFEIKDAPDAGITEYLDPVDVGCLFSANQEVTVKVYNWSCSPMINVPVEFQVTGPSTAYFSGIVPGPIPSMDFVTYTFPGTYDMTPLGIYNLSARVVGFDSNLRNDTLKESINVTLPKIVNYPHLADFEQSNELWKDSTVTGTSVFLWDPLPFMNGPEGNGSSWYAHLTPSTNDEVILESPVFDLSKISEPYLYLDLKFNIVGSSSSHYAYLEYSIDGGTAWSRLGDNTDSTLYNNFYSNNWRGTADTWTTFHQNLCDLSGEPCLKFRFRFRNWYQPEAYFAVDNFLVTDGTGDDLQPIQLYLPNAGNCNGFTDAEYPGVNIRNNFCRPLTDVPISITMTGPNSKTIIDTIPGPVPRFGYYYYQLQNDSFDMSLPGQYSFDVEVFSNTTGIGTSCINDTFPANNILTETRYGGPITTSPYSSDFNTDNGGWASIADNTHYLMIRDTLQTMNGPEGEGVSLVSVYGATTSGNSRAYIESPIFDLTNFSNPQLSFDLKYEHNNVRGKSVIVQYTLNGISWFKLGDENDPNWFEHSYGWIGKIPIWHRVQKSLCDYTNESCIKFRVENYSEYGRTNNYSAIDNFQLIDAVDDVSPIVHIDPDPLEYGCLYSTNQEITVALYNWTCSPVTDIPVTFTVSGPVNLSFTGVAPGPIAAQDSIHFKIPGTFDMTPIGKYYLETTTGLSTDQTSFNNTLRDSLEVTLPKISTYPYAVDFNASNEDWLVIESDSLADWVWDTIPFLGGDDGYGKSWYAQPLTYVGGVYLETPVFDLSNTTNPILTFETKYNIFASTSYNRINLEYSLDGGNSWSTLGTDDTPNWYSTNSNLWYGLEEHWKQMSYPLCDLVGEECVKLRFNRTFNRNRLRDFAIDNFAIRDDVDVAPIATTTPVQDDCLYSSTDAVCVEVHNFACSTTFDVPIGYELNGPTAITQMEVIDSIPSNTTINFCFSNSVDLLAIDSYTLKVFTGRSSEANRVNDTIETQFVVDHILIDTFDHFEDFNTNSGVGNWIVEDGDSLRTFLWGTVPFLNGSEGHGNSWYSESSGSSSTVFYYLESPVYDFTNVTNPELFVELKFNISTSIYYYVVLEYTIDGGATWVEYGEYTDPNWYTDSDYWEGNYSTWSLYYHDLCPMIGESCVKFRFKGRIPGANQFFAMDNWHITDTPIDAKADLVYSCSGSEYEIELNVLNRILPCAAGPHLNNLEVGYSVDGGPVLTHSFTGLNIAPGIAETLTIPNTLIPTSSSELKIWLYDPNNLDDQVFENDTITIIANNWPDCNDHCSNAYQLAIGTTTTSQTSNATIEPTEDPLFTNCGQITIENTVWYSFQTNASGGIVTAAFENIACSPSTNGIQVSIDVLSGPACLTSSLTNVYCNSPGDTNPFQYGPIVLPGNATYYIAVDGFAGNSCDFDIALSGAIQGPDCIPVAVNAILEGPYDLSTGLMTDELRVLGVIPTTEPFTGYGMAHVGQGGGEIVDPIVFDVTGNDAIIDWVFLELRDAADSSLVLSTRSALLQADGDVVDIDGIFPVQFCGLPEGNYYVAIRPRHHLATMTAFAIPLIRTVINVYDFRTGNTYVDNVNSTPQKLMSDGNWALYEGDLSADFEINALDRSLAWNARNQTGYLQEDSNMDGVCDAADRSQVWNNRNKTAHIPR